MLFKLKKSVTRFSGQLTRILLQYAYRGVKNEIDDSKHRYIIYLNLIGIITFCVTIISALIFICVNEFLAALAMLISGTLFLAWPFCLNRNGLQLSSRIGIVLYTNIIILIASCLFSHKSSLDEYYLCVAVNCNFMYTQKERKWLLFSLFITLAFFIVESTPFQYFLPSLNLIKDFQRGDKIILFGLILTVVLDVLAAVYINSLRERHLLEKQKLLEEAQRLVLVQNDDLKTFSIAASHSMQTPLNVSRYFLQRIDDNKFASTKDPEYKEYLAFVENGLSQIEQLVSGLFSYNKIINLENEVTAFDLTEESDKIKKNMLPRYPASKIRIPKIGQKLVLNKLLFNIIIHNLIDNGLKYNRSTTPEIQLEFNLNRSSVEILVKDNGIGIPKEHFDSIFVPFRRMQQEAMFGAGNGLGLAGAKRAAERMGGSLVCVESSQNGTVFQLNIPIVSSKET